MSRKYGLIWATSPYCFQTLERKLKKQSEKGWMIDKVGTLFARYKSCEPKKRSVQVIYDPDAVEYDVERSPYSQGLEEYISSAGWVKACDYFKQKIYYNDDPDAVPIETDEALRLESIKESMIGSNVAVLVTTVILAFLIGILWNVFSDILTAPGSFYVKGFPLILIMAVLYMPTTYLLFKLWVRKSEKSIEAGGGPADDRPTVIVDWIFLIATSILVLMIVISFISDSGNSGQGIKFVLEFVSFFLIVSIGRSLGLTIRNRLREHGKTGSTWIVYAAIFAVIFLLFTLREFLLG